MKTGVLMVWTGCLVSITLSVLHFAWIATAVERVLVLAPVSYTHLRAHET